MRIRITPGQALYLYGVWAPKETIAWADVLEQPTFTFAHLHRAANIPLKLLHTLQPDPGKWVHARRAALADCPGMADWSAHPVRDFRADLGDIIAQGWNADAMVAMGLTYADLVEIGLTPENMGLFTALTLLGWSQLGLSRAAAAQMPEAALVRLFGMTKQQVLQSLR
jgi:hypothetical protein